MKFVSLLTFFSFLFTTAFGQWDWVRVDSLYGDLPAAMQVYYTQTPTDGKPNKAYYVSINLKDRSIDFSAMVGNGKRYTPHEYYQLGNQPLLVINCTFFELVKNSNLNVVMR